MLGLTKREIQERFDEIVDFAELREFIDAPVKTYSSGMYMRLGFAVAIHVDPDVLLVDEVLAVGDEGFTHKCLDKFAEFRRRGKTILLVTHSLDLVERFCDEALWLDGGPRDGARRSQARRRRLPDRRRGRRRSSCSRRRRRRRSKRRRERGRTSRERGRAGQPASTGRSDVEHVPGDRRPLGLARGRDHRRRAARSRRAAVVRVPLRRADVGPRDSSARAQPIDDFVFGIGLFNADGVCCYGTNTYLEEMNPERLDRRRRGDVRDRQPRSRRRHLQARRRRPQARRLSRTTTIGCSTRSA